MSFLGKLVLFSLLIGVFQKAVEVLLVALALAFIYGALVRPAETFTLLFLLTLAACIRATVNPGDEYSVTITDNNGGSLAQATVVAGGLIDTAEEIAEQLSLDIDGDLGADFTVTYVAATNSFTVAVATIVDADGGGFFVELDTNAGFAGSGASQTLTGLFADVATADVITDFDGVLDGDEISITDLTGLSLGAGNGSNYDEGPDESSYETAYDAAELAFTASGGSLLYYMTSTEDLNGDSTLDDPSGLLFVDANLDGTPDLVILIQNNTEDTFSAGMIA